MDLNLKLPTSKKNGLPAAPTVLAGAERREAERSEADRSAAPVKTVAGPPPPVPHTEVVADAKRRTFTLEYKLRILAEADAAKGAPGGVGALLRREGIYSSHLTTWRREREAGMRQALTPKTRGPKRKHDPQRAELDQLRRQNQRLTEALRKAELIIEVQKKVGMLMEPPRPENPQEKD
jgi:transposase-like protein